MTTAREVLALVITADGKGAINEVKKVGSAAKQDLGDAESAATKFRTNTSAALIAGGAAAVAAGGATLLVLKKESDQYVATARDAMKLQRVSGDSAENSSRLGYAAQQSGVGVDQLATSIVRLSKNAESDIGAKQLKELGVGLKDAQGNARPTIAVMEDIAARVAVMPNGFEKNALAVRLFGRAGADLLPLLNKGRDGIRALAAESDKFGLTFDQSDFDDVKQYVVLQRELAAAKKGLQVQVGETVFPFVTSGLEKATSVMSSATEGLHDMDPAMRSTLGTALTFGAGFVTVAGGMSVIIGTGSKLIGNLRDQEGQLGRTGTAIKGIGVALVALTAVEAAMAGVNYLGGFSKNVDDDVNRIIAASGKGAGSVKELADAFLEEGKKLKVTDLFATVGAHFEIGGLKNILIPGSDKAIPSSDAQAVVDKMKAANLSAAESNLKAWQAQNEGLDHNSDAYRRNKEFIDDNLRSISAAKNAQDAMQQEQDGTSASVDQVTYSLNAQTFALQYNQNQTEQSKGIYVTYAETVKSAMDPILGLLDANKQLADAEKHLAEVKSGSTPEVISATQRLADAQQRLNDVLADDPMFGLRSVSAESQIADARNRLAAANERLAANPDDAKAMTAKDEAISDLEAASKRRQDEKRSAQQRSNQIRDARRDVADASSELAKARADTGATSAAYSDASIAVIRANLNVQTSTAELAQYLQDHGVTAVGEINSKLDEWISKGGPLGAAASHMKDQLQPLVVQSLFWAAGLQAVNQELDTIAGKIAPGGMWQQDGKLYANQGGKAVQVQGPVQVQPSSNRRGGSGSFGRALGGPVNARQPYEVAEERPELLVLSRPGYVVPDLSRLAAGVAAGGGADNSVHLNTTIVQHVPEPVLAGAAVVQTLRGIAWRAGKGLRAPASRN